MLRLLVDDDLPLNEGALDPFEIAIEPGGLFDPQHPAAVAGGNVEASQRLVDAILRAIGVLAASQGTMNNLTVGTSRGAWYETIGGGAGAGATFDGASSVQVHMTNTRATDVEELETRYPVRLERFARWRGSGGRGQHRGGDGTEKVWRFLEPADVALLAGRRTAGAPGLEGGEPGRPGIDERDVGGGFEPAPACWHAESRRTAPHPHARRRRVRCARGRRRYFAEGKVNTIRHSLVSIVHARRKSASRRPSERRLHVQYESALRFTSVRSFP